MLTIVLLLISNVFMTFAWYGHLKHKVPANRIGSGSFTTTQLKVIQEVITLVVFTGFSLLYLKEQMKWNYVVGFGFILLAVFFVFHDFGPGKSPAAPAELVAHGGDAQQGDAH